VVGAEAGGGELMECLEEVLLHADLPCEIVAQIPDGDALEDATEKIVEVQKHMQAIDDARSG
jgi:hypothetical protein